jgi:uncharacterized membrane protein YqjE
MTTETQAPHDEGLIASLHRLAQTAIHVLVTRFEILSTEIAEERVNLTKLAMVALVVLFCVQAGLILGVLFVVLAVSPENRLMAIGIASLALLAGALGGVLWMRAWLKRRPPMFATTIEELRKDGRRLRRDS